MSKAVIFFAPGLEECEGLLCVDLLRRSGVEVTIAAVGGEKIVKSARSISVVADALAEELDYSAFDAAILPGGIPGVDNLKADATVRKVCTEFAAAGKVVAAICAAPSVLAAFGILQGKKATVYPGMEDKLTAAGAEYTGLPITLDGNIITGEALGAAIPFALALASRLAGQQASNAVKQGIVYRYWFEVKRYKTHNPASGRQRISVAACWRVIFLVVAVYANGALSYISLRYGISQFFSNHFPQCCLSTSGRTNNHDSC